MTHYSLWLSEPNFICTEVALACGVKRVLLDIEHGAFPIDKLSSYVAFAKASGMHVLAKVAGPTAEAIQQAIDVGVDGVIIPHITSAAQARELCATAKFPPRGTRSYAGGRTVNYMAPPSDYCQREDARLLCLPMIESAGAMAEVEAILALDTVDGIFPGPTDLALTSGRGQYVFDGENRKDLERCAKAARAAGKIWVMPAWTAAERAFAVEHGAQEIVVGTQTSLIRNAIVAMQNTLRAEGIAID
ncbi:HpcH/HpaI aldolase family protein [Bordetella genomosp. 12]|uniref:Host specificity protein n=1 Tax=Bordetella genomosp. 12 TaxID=463035 RepID=A0A261V9S2_9BORD|nr:aldolase/citrate lyase family protein [Bordetella genomosp. 12]OZI70914.1 host specificity protein [Bordetella genomosp. 12]